MTQLTMLVWSLTLIQTSWSRKSSGPLEVSLWTKLFPHLFAMKWWLILLKRSLVFPILFLSSVSLHWLLRKAFLSLLASLWNPAFRGLYLSFSPLLLTSLLFTAICKASSDSHFVCCLFFFVCVSFPWGWSWSLYPGQCHEPPPIVHQALCL